MKTINNESPVDFLMSNMEACTNWDHFLLIFWEYWVASVTLDSREFQMVFANAAVNRWFFIELEKQEDEFKTLSALYPEVSGSAKDQLYCELVSKLMSRFPLALLANAKKREPKKKLKAQGISIAAFILNQN